MYIICATYKRHEFVYGWCYAVCCQLLTTVAVYKITSLTLPPYRAVALWLFGEKNKTYKKKGFMEHIATRVTERREIALASFPDTDMVVWKRFFTPAYFRLTYKNNRLTQRETNTTIYIKHSHLNTFCIIIV